MTPTKSMAEEALARALAQYAETVVYEAPGVGGGSLTVNRDHEGVTLVVEDEGEYAAVSLTDAQRATLVEALS